MSSREILLDVWKEACRHIRMEESVDRIAAILATVLPLDGLSVLVFDSVHGTVLARAGSFVPPARLVGGSGAQPARAGVQALERWIGEGEPVFHRHGRAPHAVSVVLGVDAKGGDCVLVPLVSDEGVRGIMLLQLPADTALSDPQRQLVRELIEPFSVALENDHRLHALSALREAAEASQRSALSRLGREELIGSIVGADAGLRRVMERVELVAGADIAVLILGETGSGKEVVARAIHDRSTRAAGPFIRVNCGAIPAELIDSELFGHEKGAFTGATAVRRGWFERADGGTLLLDEIGELPLPAQVRLLRVLQEGAFERVGGEKTLHVDVRIVAATHRDLPGMVQQGRFREDLWYRITGFQMVLPPLRERGEDIPALARHFVERACRRFGARPLSLSEADLALLASYAWPGNVRELASVIDRAVILGEGGSLDVASALGRPTSLRTVDPVAAGGSGFGLTDGRSAPAASAQSGHPTLDDAMRAYIESILAVTGGRIEGKRGAARILGINPHTLRARMRKLGIDWARFRVED